MSRRAKIALWSGTGLLAVVLMLLTAFFVIPNTEAGRALIVRKVAEFTHDRVRLAGIQGSFPAALRLDRLELRDSKGLWLWADHIALRWSPADLLRRHVNVASLDIARLHVERSPVPEPDETPSKSSSIPDTDLKDLTIEALELGEALAGKPTSLTVKAHAHLRSLEEVTAHLAARRIEGNGEYQLDAQVDSQSIDATFKLQEPAQGPLANLMHAPEIGAIQAVATLKGPRAAEDLLLSVEAGQLRASANGRVDLEHGAADLKCSMLAPPMSPSEGLQWDRIELEGQLHGPFAKLAAEGHLLVRALKAPGGVQVASAAAQVSGDQGAIRVQAGIDGLQIPGSAPGLLKDSPLTLDATIRLDEPKRPVIVKAHHGLFDLDAKAFAGEHPTAELNLRVPDLRPFAPLTGMPIRGDAQLTAQVDYTAALTRMTANLDTHLDGGKAAWSDMVRGGLTRAQMTVNITDQELELETAKVTGPALFLTVDGRAERTGAGKIKARFDLRLPNLRRASPALAGDLRFAGTLEGPRARLSADTRIDSNLSVRGSSRAALSARIRADGLPKSPQGTIEAEGELDGAPLHLDAELQPAGDGEYRGIIHRADWKSAHAGGDVSFGKSSPRGSAKLIVGDLSDFNRLAELQLAGSVHGQLQLASQGSRSNVEGELEAHDVVAGGMTGNGRVNVSGPMDALKVMVTASSPAIAGRPAQLDAMALVNVDAKELELASLKASYHDQNLALVNPARLEFAQGLKIQHLKLGIQQAFIEFDGQVSPTLNFRASVRHIQPSLVNAFVPDLLSSGVANADATIAGTTSAPTGTLHLEALDVRAKSDQAKGLPAADLRANANLDGGIAQLDARLTAGGNSQLSLTGRVPLNADESVDLKLAGDLNLALANPLLEASGRHVAGRVTIDTSVKGRRDAPEIAGTVRLRNGSVHDYTQGLSLTEITGDLSGEQGVLKIEQLTARAAPGMVSLSGTVGVLQPKLPVDIRLTAKNAQPIASNIVTANLDANIQVSGTAREALEVKGKVHLNRADVTIPGGLPPDVPVLDVERAGAAPASASNHPLTTNLHLDVDAPNRILIKGRGLDAEMGGELHVTGTAQEPQVDGGFELQRGFFTLANSKLRFTTGTVTFNGTGLQKKLDPSLDFTAQSKAAEVTAIVRITGVADAPQIELSSTPELPQDEILARLLFGQPAAQLSAVELVETGVALSSLRGGGDGPSLNPIDRIQKALGLDRLSVSSASSSSSSSSTDQKAGTSVEAGRYVSSRVYVGVKEGTAGASQVDVDVDLTKSLKLQAQLGNGTATAQGVTPENDPGSSLGLAYQFEY